MIIAVASLGIISKIIYFPLAFALYSPLGAYAGSLVGIIISILAAAIITGAVFTQKIWEENRTRTITKITVLLAAFVWVTALLEIAPSADWTPKNKAEWLTMNPAATPTAFEWYYIENLVLNLAIFISIIFALVLGFIGLYIGSTLKKPAKT